MRCIVKNLVSILILALVIGFIAPHFVSEKMDLNLEHASPPTSKEISMIRQEALSALDNPWERILLWPGKLVISKQYSISTYEVNAYTLFGLRFATLQVKCFAVCSSFRKQNPGELEVSYVGEEINLNKSSYDTTGWKTYKSDQYYSLKYKPGWVIQTSPRGSYPSYIAEELSVQPKVSYSYGPSSLISISVFSGLNFDEFERDIKVGKHIDDPLTPVVFNGKKGYIQNGTYYIYHKDNMYQISFDPNEAFGLTEDEEMTALTSIEFID